MAIYFIKQYSERESAVVCRHINALYVSPQVSFNW